MQCQSEYEFEHTLGRPNLLYRAWQPGDRDDAGVQVVDMLDLSFGELRHVLHEGDHGFVAGVDLDFIEPCSENGIVDFLQFRAFEVRASRPCEKRLCRYPVEVHAHRVVGKRVDDLPGAQLLLVLQNLEIVADLRRVRGLHRVHGDVVRVEVHLDAARQVGERQTLRPAHAGEPVGVGVSDDAVDDFLGLVRGLFAELEPVIVAVEPLPDVAYLHEAEDGGEALLAVN